MCQPKQIAVDDPRFLELDTFLKKLQGEKGIAMIALQKAQQLFGYLPLEVHKHISAFTGISVAELYGVSSFYSQFLLEAEGKHRISVCMGTACYVKGSQKVLDKLCELLNIKVGEVSSDGLFSITAARCIGCCGLAPVIMIDEEVYANIVDLNELEQILDSYRSKEAAAVTVSVASADNKGEAEDLA
ncbi:MAG: NAD(P)H-dependent oxidoreductase subunit E [Clostridiaceae bacterium]|jgi:NADH:ubiquinone oxidoreductase subunit E|nr:NAD(P)H-dependent oxidoreductase subunit E [Clostridiaceae bacterium]